MVSVRALLTTPAPCTRATLPDRIIYGWPLAPVASPALMLVLTWCLDGRMTIRLVGIDPDDVLSG